MPSYARWFLLMALPLSIACTPDDSGPTAAAPPVAPQTSTELAANIQSATSWTWSEENFDLRPRFAPDQVSQLLPEYSVDGRRLRIRVRQVHDPVRSVYELRLAIINKSDAVAWSPMQLTGTISRGRLPFAGADQLQSATVGTWDYGQFLGTDGSLVPGETSEERVVALTLPAGTPLRVAVDGLIVTARIRWARTVASIPNLSRIAEPSELAQGFMNGAFVVRYHGGVLSQTELARLNLAYGLVSQAYAADGLAYIAFSTDLDSSSTRATAARLLQDPSISMVYPAPTRTPTGSRTFALPGTTETQQQDIDVNLPGAWAAAEGRGITPGRGVTIGYIDTGTDAVVSELGGRVTLASADCFGVLPCPTGDYSTSNHGTAVGSLLGATSDLAGFAGAAYGADLVSIRTTYTPWSIWSALAYVKSHPAIRILNLSYAGPYPDAIEAAGIQLLASSGVLVVAAAGNNDRLHGGPNAPISCLVGQPSYPAATPGVLAVGGYTGTGASPSNSYDCNGSHITIIAPDLSPLTGGRGTSFASPRVAGAAAVLLGLNPSLSAQALRAELLTKHTSAVANASAWGSTSVARLFMGFGGIVGTVTSPQLGALTGITVRTSGQALPSPSTTTRGPGGDFRLEGLVPGHASLVLGNLPSTCTDPSMTVNVVAGQSSRADIVVDCVTTGPSSGIWLGTYDFGALRLDLTQAGNVVSGNVTGSGNCVAYHSGTISGTTVILDYVYTVDPGTAGAACYPTNQRLTGVISVNGDSMSGNGSTSYGGGAITWTFNVTKQ